jgi:hypothetical protein
MRRQSISGTANPAAAKIGCLLIGGAIAGGTRFTRAQ